MNPFYLILGIAALVYVPTIYGLMKLEYKIISLLPTDIQEDRITLNAGMELTNTSVFRLTINRIVCDVFLNGTMIGTITNTLNTPIPAGHKQVIGLNIEITPDNLGTEMWSIIINKNLQNSVIVLKGKISANGKTLPLDAQWTMEDFTK